MFRGVVPFDSSGNAVRLYRIERFVQRSRGVGVEVVADQNNALRIAVARIRQPLDEVSEVLACASLGDLDAAPAGKRFEGDEDLGRSVTHVFAVGLPRRARSQGKGLTDFADQLLAKLVHADHGPGRVVGSSVRVQDIFHVRHEGGVCLRRNHPLLPEPRLDLVFFSVRQTVAGSMLSTTSIATNRSASSFIVQRARPLGGSLHVSAMRRASCSPSNFRYDRRPVGFRLYRVASNPSATNCFRTTAAVWA